jgi:hypothetical protein
MGGAGCSVDGTGAVVGTVTTTPAATVVSVTTFGGSGRIMAQDSGLALGYSRTVYLYPPEAGAGLPTGRHVGHVPMPAGPPSLIHRRVYGAGVDFATGVHLTVGLRDLVMPIPDALPADAGVSISYDAEAPTRSRVGICRPQAATPC